MRFSMQQHPFYCGIAVHARPLSLCVLQPAGALLGPRHRPAGSAPLLTAVAPYRTALVVCVAWIFT
jgi:hypothetical protein